MSQPELELISSAVLKELADTGAVRDAAIVPASNGFCIKVTCGPAQQAAQRVVQAHGHVRMFKTIDAAANALRGFGILRAVVDLSPGDLPAAALPQLSSN
jgi:hypothetical protein